ncbi:AMP-binding protein [Nannocystis sp.]|uniref:AMP-binding protein n=1 Tax=Nannocystis sp. TaxID=1962667 RepID=UPI0025D9DB7A|nr:AMP-binding protein [Nannocystis sp.]MBK7827574.1 AMP-binding protein [Nannocystis sp.]
MSLFPCLAAPDDRPLLTVDATTLTARDLLAAAARHAAFLAAADIHPGDHIGVWTQPHLHTPVALAANALCGVVSVPLNPKLGAREAAHVAADAAPRLCLAAAPDELPVGPLGRAAALAHLSDRTCPIAPVPGTSPGPLLILYTSGTTGAPKGAVLSAAAITSNLDALAHAWDWRPGDTVLHALPLFHVHGLVLGWFGSLRVGGRLHWQPRFDPAALAAALPGAILFAVPTMFHRLADAAEHDPTIASALRLARLLISGSAALPLREHQRISALAGRGVYERYGLTETLINCAVPVTGPPQPGRVGPPLPGVELNLCDDDHRPLATGDDQTIGEIAVRGPNLFSNYLNNPTATAAVRDADGWFYTGDLATRDAAGSLRIVGRRATDLIKSGGFKIGAGEIEACLAEHPEVCEVAVVGAPDPDLGERIVAFVVARDPAAPPSAAALCDLVAAALAPHKRPRAVHFVAELPRNAMGKLLKAELRARLEP